MTDTMEQRSISVKGQNMKADDADTEARLPVLDAPAKYQDQDTERHPYEVQWDGGDSDPMNPRSMSYARKWLIVFVVSLGGLDV